MDKMPVLFRKRIIPEECIELKDDMILRCDENVIVTGWKALHPKKDLACGYSCYYLRRGIKVSRFIDHSGQLLYWYCDIVDYDWNKDRSVLTVTDLLADVLLYPDGRLKVVDLDELAEALRRGLIDDACIERTLLHLSSLLEIIYSRQFSSLTRPILEIMDPKKQDGT